jgi:hypothetical protein
LVGCGRVRAARRLRAGRLGDGEARIGGVRDESLGAVVVGVVLWRGGSDREMGFVRVIERVVWFPSGRCNDGRGGRYSVGGCSGLGERRPTSDGFADCESVRRR